MAASVTITGIVKEPGGAVRIRLGKFEYCFNNLQDARDAARDFDAEDLRALVLRLILTRQPNLGNPAALVGRTVTIDPTSASWGTVS